MADRLRGSRESLMQKDAMSAIEQPAATVFAQQKSGE
jgi:hypothetical protein